MNATVTGLEAAHRARLEREVESILKLDEAQFALHHAIQELAQYRDGTLQAGRLNSLIGACVGLPGGAARHHAITEILTQEVLDAEAQLRVLRAQDTIGQPEDAT